MQNRNGQAGGVWLQQNQDAVEFVVAAKDPEDVGHIPIVLLQTFGVSDARSVDEADPCLSDGDTVHRSALSGRLASGSVVFILALANLDVLLNKPSLRVGRIFQLGAERAGDQALQVACLNRVIERVVGDGN
jgi:hypothetical protein